MPNDIVLSTNTPLQMAQLLDYLGRGQSIMPPRPKPSIMIKNHAGAIDFNVSPVTERQFPVVFIRYISACPEQLREAVMEANSETLDRLGGGSMDALKEILAPSDLEGQPSEADDIEIRDMAGTLFNPAIHSTRKSDGRPVIKNDGTFAARRGTKTIKAVPTPFDQLDKDQENPTELGEKGVADVDPAFHVLRDASGGEINGGPIDTAEGWTSMLIDILSSDLQADVHTKVMEHNKDGVARLSRENKIDLIGRIDAVSLV